MGDSVGDSLRLGRIAGIPLGLHWSALGMVLLVAAVLGLGVLPASSPGQAPFDRWLAAALGSLAFAVSLLAHELGHAVVARRHRVGVDGITLWLLGGVARLARQAPTPRAELGIALAGPGVSAGLGAVLVAVAVGLGERGGPLAAAVVLWLGLVNLLLAVVNLLPGAPLDGGRVLAALLWWRTGDPERARVVAGRAGLVLGAGLLVVGLAEVLVWARVAGVGTAAVGVFLLAAARREVAAAVVRARLHRLTMGQVMAPHPPPVPDWLTVDRFLAWCGERGAQLAFPVVRWGTEPIGWVSADLATPCRPPASSWTPVARAMLADHLAPRAWASEPVDEVLARLHDHLPHLVVVLDPRTGSVAGTVAAARLHALFERPDPWGRERPAA